jgi:death-on-curing protein
VTEWVWLDAQDATAIHNRALMLHGGAGGIRDEGLLQSVLARPRQIEAYTDNADAIALAAAYTAGIVKNHPFVDGNKRTGFILGVLFLELNGKRFVASEEDAAGAVLALAAGEWDDDAYITFLRANTANG